METKPKILFDKTNEEILSDISKRLVDGNEFHRRCEVVACSILNMMLEKTLMYGGNDDSIPLKQKILRMYYEGIGRKSNRLPKIVERSTDGDLEAMVELIDTVVDIAGYCMLGLSAIAEDIQNEQVS